MNEILETKLKEYASYNFENKDFKIWLRDSNLWMALYSILRIRGVEMDKKELVEVLDGKLVEDIPLDVYGFIHRFKDLYKEMNASIGMQESMNEKLFSKFYSIIFDGDGYRKDNPIIYKWGYIAPHFSEIKESLATSFRNVSRIANPVERACMMHNEINAIYPYGTDSAAMAIVCLVYVLLEAGIPIPSITVDDEDYNKLVTDYFDKKTDDINEMFERSILNRLESVILLGKESLEI